MAGWNSRDAPKDLIRVGGENVSPAEVEDILNRHPAIRQAVVVGVPDPRLMEVPCAFVILNDGHAEMATKTPCWTGRRRTWPPSKRPATFRVVDGFERIGMTASSKIQKAQLRTHAVALLGLGLMRIETAVTRMLGIDLPIIQAGMSWASSSAALPLAVSQGGRPWGDRRRADAAGGFRGRGGNGPRRHRAPLRGQPAAVPQGAPTPSSTGSWRIRCRC